MKNKIVVCAMLSDYFSPLVRKRVVLKGELIQGDSFFMRFSCRTHEGAEVTVVFPQYDIIGIAIIVALVAILLIFNQNGVDVLVKGLKALKVRSKRDFAANRRCFKRR